MQFGCINPCWTQLKCRFIYFFFFFWYLFLGRWWKSQPLYKRVIHLFLVVIDGPLTCYLYIPLVLLFWSSCHTYLPTSLSMYFSVYMCAHACTVCTRGGQCINPGDLFWGQVCREKLSTILCYCSVILVLPYGELYHRLALSVFMTQFAVAIWMNEEAKKLFSGDEQLFCECRRK